jgi:hypothetical protein
MLFAIERYVCLVCWRGFGELCVVALVSAHKFALRGGVQALEFSILCFKCTKVECPFMHLYLSEYEVSASWEVWYIGVEWLQKQNVCVAHLTSVVWHS